MPFNPAQYDRSGLILAAGITGAANSIADKIDKTTAETKKLKAYRSMAVDGLGLDADEVDNMDLPTLEGKMQSLAVRNLMQGMAEKKQQMGFAAQDQGFRQAEATRAQANFDYQGQQRAAAHRMMQDGVFSGVGPTGPMQPDFSPNAFLGAAGRAGYDMSPHDIAQLMEAGRRENAPAFFQRGDAEKAAPIAPGFLRAVLGPNTSQVIPDMTNAGAAVPITGPNGEDLGFGLPGRSGVTPLRSGEVTEKDQFTALQAEKRALIAAKGRSLPSAQAAYDAAIAELDKTLSGLKPGKGGAAAAGPAGAGAGEVVRLTADGRQAVFDAKTKAFKRYAN